jgi:hypothetical protein
MAKRGKRQKLKAAINLMSASGSGKSLSALFIAKGLMKGAYPDLTEEEIWAKIGVVDSEHDRMLYYIGNEKAGVYIPDEAFYHYSLKAPYTVDRYVAAIDELKADGCEVIIVDSLSHAWSKDGGLLDLQQEFGGRYQDWKKVNPYEQKLHRAIFENDVHIITTMRTKQEYSLEKNELEKLEVTKLGTKPIQRDDMEYEYMLVFQMDKRHVATTTKDNTGLFEGKGFVITPKAGEILFDWLDKGVDVRKQQAERTQFILEYISQSTEKYAKVKDTMKEIELKSKKKVVDFNLEWLERAFSILEPLVIEAELEVKASKKSKAKEDKEHEALEKELGNALDPKK